ncbi:MAG: hypothetical protein AB1306_02655 [Nitrospirota bacterium]
MTKDSIINGCMKVEKSAAAIYQKLMIKFLEKGEFWKELFDDEKNHISFLKDVKSLGLIDVMEKTDPLPSKKVINETIKLADDLKVKITSDSVSFKKALVMALKLEESMVEMYTNKLIADLIACEDEVSHKKIVADEKTHLRKIKKMMK